MTKTTDAIAQFIVDTRFEDIPSQVTEEAKKVMLDCLGITLAGSLEPAGNAARNGVLAALLAKKGFTGTDEVLEGKFGFCQCFCGSDGYNLDKMTGNLGKTYEFTTPGVGLKQYPACMSNHRALDAVFNLMKEHAFSWEEVEKVEYGVGKDVIDHLFYLHPQTALEGKFSLQYCIAIALLDGKVGLGQFADEKVRDPKVHELMGKIHVYEHPETKDKARNDQFSEVRVYLKGGQIFSNSVKLARGRPGNPLEYDEIVSKYRECARLRLPDESVEKLLSMVEHIEDMEDIRLLTDLLR